jgi:pimeloyl-ACP methyl ester carboxylesterase
MQRASTTPTRAVHYLASMVEDGVEASARAINVPTLVMQRRDDMLIPFARGRRLASLIPGANFLSLEGANHWLLFDDPGAPAFVGAVEDFLAS